MQKDVGHYLSTKCKTNRILCGLEIDPVCISFAISVALIHKYDSDVRCKCIYQMNLPIGRKTLNKSMCIYMRCWQFHVPSDKLSWSFHPVECKISEPVFRFNNVHGQKLYQSAHLLLIRLQRFIIYNRCMCLYCLFGLKVSFSIVDIRYSILNALFNQDKVL